MQKNPYKFLNQSNGNKPGVGFCGNIERWLVLAGLTIIHCCPFVLNWGDSLEPCWCCTRDLCRGVVGSWCCLTGDLGSWGAGRTPTGDWGRAWRRGTGVGAWGKATVVTTVVGPLQPWGPPEKVKKKNTFKIQKLSKSRTKNSSKSSGILFWH